MAIKIMPILVYVLVSAVILQKHIKMSKKKDMLKDAPHGGQVTIHARCTKCMAPTKLPYYEFLAILQNAFDIAIDKQAGIVILCQECMTAGKDGPLHR